MGTKKKKSNKNPQFKGDKFEKISAMLDKKKNPYKTMAIGVHNGSYYFGSILYWGLKKVPVVITDAGKVFWYWVEKTDEGKIVDNTIRKEFGLNYRFELFDDCIDNLWSNKSIKMFIDGKAPEQKFKTLFEAIRNKNKELMYHIDDRIHSFIACDIIKNYFYVLFNANGRTYFQAEFASGKSKQSLIYQKLSFNSLFASTISPASFERVIESTGGTIIVDNFDNCHDELKKAILQCIEVYYKKGGKNIKSAGQGFEKNKPIAFNGYSPLVINNIIGLPQVTESRCNKIQMLKTDKKDVVDVKINEADAFWEETKDNLHILALQKWKTVQKTYEGLEVPELTARDLEKTEAVLTIAKCIGSEVYNDVLSYLLESFSQQSIKEVQDDWAFILFDYLNEVVRGDIKKVMVKDIVDAVGFNAVNSQATEKNDKTKFGHYCGKVLKNIPLFRRGLIKGYPYYEIKRGDLDKIIRIKGFEDYLTTPLTPLTPFTPLTPLAPPAPFTPLTPNTPLTLLTPHNNSNNSNNNNKRGVSGVKGV